MNVENYTKLELSKKLKELKLPILFSDKRQLNFYKNGKYVAGYDPVYEIKIINDEVFITGGQYTYQHNLNEFDEFTIDVDNDTFEFYKDR